MVPPAGTEIAGARRIVEFLSFVLRLCFCGFRDGRAPEEVADQMILADIVAEEVDAWLSYLVL